MSSANLPREQQTPSFFMTAFRDIATVLARSPFIRGFQCDDETIRYPYKDSTVSSGLCYFVGSGLNIVTIFIMEYYLVARQSAYLTTERRERQKFDHRLFVKNVYCRLIVWLFGALASELLTDIFKFGAGRLRPHFIDVCKPIVRISPTSEMPIDSYCQKADNRYMYITNYYCSGEPSKQRDARLSFLSGHSSYSAYSAAFAVFYLQATLDGRQVGLIRPSIQVLIISLAFYTGLSRISDYKHHWQDVLAGLTLGTVVAAIMIRSVWPTFSKAYERFTKGASRTQGDLAGEELNRVSY